MKKNKELKKIQHRANKEIREINKILLEDDLWKGRFYIKQINRIDRFYSDHSGYSILFIFEIKDLKTNLSKNIYYHMNSGYANIRFSWGLFEEINEFIVTDCEVWKSEDDPRADKTIYRYK